MVERGSKGALCCHYRIVWSPVHSIFRSHTVDRRDAVRRDTYLLHRLPRSPGRCKECSSFSAIQVRQPLDFLSKRSNVTNSTTNLYLVDIVSLVSSKLPEKCRVGKKEPKRLRPFSKTPVVVFGSRYLFVHPHWNTCRKRQFRGNCDRGGITHQAIQLDSGGGLARESL